MQISLSLGLIRTSPIPVFISFLLCYILKVLQKYLHICAGINVLI